jgi:hypothetical protein
VKNRHVAPKPLALQQRPTKLLPQANFVWTQRNCLGSLLYTPKVTTIITKKNIVNRFFDGFLSRNTESNVIIFEATRIGIRHPKPPNAIGKGSKQSPSKRPRALRGMSYAKYRSKFLGSTFDITNYKSNRCIKTGKEKSGKLDQ